MKNEYSTHVTYSANFLEGDFDEAIHLYRHALQLLKDSNSATLDDDIMEKIRIDLAELLHSVGRYLWFHGDLYLLLYLHP